MKEKNILRDKEISLRYPKLSDLKEYHIEKNDREIARNFITHTYPWSIEDAKKKLNQVIYLNSKKVKSQEVLLITYNGKVVGEIGIKNLIINHKGLTHSWIGKKWRGKGIMTRARKLFVKYIKEKFNLKRIYSFVIVQNKANKKVLEKCGFKLEGIMMNDVKKGNRFYDTYLFALTT